jgi:hypothetical protein
MAELDLPRSWLYYITIEEMNFTITETLCASRVEKWIRAVKQRFLDAAPIKCVGLDCEFTTPHDKVNQRAIVLQLLVASEVSIFDAGRMITQLGTPRGRYDEYSSKFSLSKKSRFVDPIGKSQT